MTQRAQEKIIFSFLCIFLVLWMGLALTPKFHLLTADSAASYARIIELFLHVGSLYLIAKIYLALSEDDRKIFFWVLMSATAMFINDACFYLVISIEKILKISFADISFYVALLWWIFSLIVVYYKIIRRYLVQGKNYIKIIITFLILNLIIIFFFIKPIMLTTHFFSIQPMYEVSAAFLLLIVFDLSVISLSCTKNTGMMLFTAGTIITIAGDFWIKFSFIAHKFTLFDYGEFFWLLGLLISFFGLLFLYVDDNNLCLKNWFNKFTSIRSNLIFWTFSVSVFCFIVFFTCLYALKVIDQAFLTYLPFFILVYSVLIIFSTIFIGRYLEAPFNQLAVNIDRLMYKNNKALIDKHFVIDEFIFLQKVILEAYEYKEEKDKATKKLAETATQVAHDIRSPLAALTTCLKQLPQIPEHQRILMRNAANRINDIANNLLAKHKGRDSTAASHRVWLVAPLVESIISEKRAQFDNRPLELDSEITSEGFAAFSEFDGVEMKRLLSNLINNASEAFDAKGGKITVVLSADDQHLFLSVKDNGCGIPEDKLSAVLEPGVSLKEKGNGLGLSHAKQTLEDWGGSLALSSVVGEGTEVKLSLVRVKAPSWFVSSIEVSEARLIGILDDDASIHDAWDQRLREVSATLQVHHFRTSADFIRWYQKQSSLDSEASLRESQNDAAIQVFSDYELLGDAMTGLEVLETLELGRNALLVTSHYENSEIIERCQKRGIRLLPKNLLAHVPIRRRKTEDREQTTQEEARVSKLEELFAALQKAKGAASGTTSIEVEAISPEADTRPINTVFIDDDPYNHELWAWSAKQAKKRLLCLTDLAGFEAIEASLLKTTAIYIDLNLADGVKGLDVAKTLYDRGFSNLHIATGYADFNKADYPFLLSVIDKEPPF